MGPAFRVTDPAEFDAVSGALVGPAYQLRPTYREEEADLIQWH
jgi:hypothetical protein